MMKTILKNADLHMPRTDYPRPQWQRKEWYCLNGKWDFAFDFGRSGESRGMWNAGEYPLTITVPFCPESKLSGIEYKDFIPAVWYRKTISLDVPDKSRAMLHFGAADHFCKVWVNGVLCGSHKGGYTAFSIEITDAIKDGENVFTVYCEDDTRSKKQPIGKQSETCGSAGCSYTRTTGIWQTVWLEYVPESFMQSAKITPRAADSSVEIIVRTDGAKYGDKVRAVACYDGKKVGTAKATVIGKTAALNLTVKEKHLWDVGKPELYDLSLVLETESGEIKDAVDSYFALRDVTLSKKALEINGRPVFLRHVLDQGFNPDGIYTAPSDEFLKKDIELSMALGFNGARFHQRVFEDRSLYWADKLGYTVWCELPYGVDIGTSEFIENALPEWTEMIKTQYNHPCVIGWIVTNETYHCPVIDENAVKLMYRITKDLDPTRPVIDASGGIHYETDMFDVHEYEGDPAKLTEYLEEMRKDEKACHVCGYRYRAAGAPYRKETYKGQPYWISEYGGVFWNPETVKNGGTGWGYGKAPKTEEEFAQRYAAINEILLSHPRICGFCYTQLTDIEQEQNGLYYYDRREKFSKETYDKIRAANTGKAAIEE